jgi:hypothetical protein
MATRKSGDGSRNADVGSERPGSYAKVSGSRRRRKGRRGASSIPPADDAGAAGVASRGRGSAPVVDTVGESDDGRISDLGDDNAVDDLRRPSKPSSNRAPRKEVGPLGMEDIRSEPPANTVDPSSLPPRERVPSDSPHVKVVEINSAASRSERRHTQLEVDDEREDTEPEVRRYPSLPERSDQELAREYDLDASAIGRDIRASMRPARTSLARLDAPYGAQDAPHSLSSVLGARPSLRPSPPPEKQRDAASILWWLVVSGLTAIIAAAVTIAAREQLRPQEESAVAPVADVAPAPPTPALERLPPPVSFGTPQTTPKPLPDKPPPPKEPRSAATPSAAAVVPAANSAAVRPGAPGTSAVTGAAATARPVNPTGPRASAAKQVASHKAAVAAPAKQSVAPPAGPAIEAERAPAEPGYAPGYSKEINPATSYAPGYSSKPTLRPAPDAERGKPNLVPMRETTETELPGLPVNPYD